MSYPGLSCAVWYGTVLYCHVLLCFVLSWPRPSPFSKSGMPAANCCRSGIVLPRHLLLKRIGLISGLCSAFCAQRLVSSQHVMDRMSVFIADLRSGAHGQQLRAGYQLAKCIADTVSHNSLAQSPQSPFLSHACLKLESPLQYPCVFSQAGSHVLDGSLAVLTGTSKHCQVVSGSPSALLGEREWQCLGAFSRPISWPSRSCVT